MSSKNREGGNPPLPVTPILLQRGFSYRLGHFGEECSRLFLFPPFSFTFFPKREREKKKEREKKQRRERTKCVPKRADYIHAGTLTRHSPLPGRAVPFVLQARDEKTAHQGKVFELCVWTHKKRSLSLPLNPFLVLKLCFGDSALGVSSFLCSRLFSREKKKKEDSKIFFFFFPLKKKRTTKNTPKTIFEQSRARCGVRKRSSRLLRL